MNAALAFSRSWRQGFVGPVSRHRLDDKMILVSPILDHLLMRGIFSVAANLLKATAASRPSEADHR
jgi:hypothetical protein